MMVITWGCCKCNLSYVNRKIMRGFVCNLNAGFSLVGNNTLIFYFKSYVVFVLYYFDPYWIYILLSFILFNLNFNAIKRYYSIINEIYKGILFVADLPVDCQTILNFGKFVVVRVWAQVILWSFGENGTCKRLKG